MDGGLEWGSMYVVAGISGAGKSSFANILETDIFDLNPKEKFKVLSFNFEMASYRQILRKISNKTKKTVGELKSSNNILTDDEMDNIEEIAKKISLYDIHYVDIPGSIIEIWHTILEFQKNNPDHKVFIILDHARLSKKIKMQSEQHMMDDLCNMFTTIKKRINCSILLLSQLNREIESRTSTPSMHYPTRGDIFGNDGIYQHSDFVFVIHRPELLGIKYYGMERIPTENAIFLHMLKNRDGDCRIIKMTNNLKYNLIEEDTNEI